jgi:hypothetical protein
MAQTGLSALGRYEPRAARPEADTARLVMPAAIAAVVAAAIITEGIAPIG